MAVCVSRLVVERENHALCVLMATLKWFPFTQITMKCYIWMIAAFKLRKMNARLKILVKIIVFSKNKMCSYKIKGSVEPTG